LTSGIRAKTSMGPVKSSCVTPGKTNIPILYIRFDLYVMRLVKEKNNDLRSAFTKAAYRARYRNRLPN
jgi:hypothetical protein